MKRPSIVCVTLFLMIVAGIQARAQEKKISKKDLPRAVLSAFEQSYPNARIKGYSTEMEEGKTFYEIESMKDKMSLDVSYLSDGTVAEIEEGIAVGMLPDPVKASVKANFPRGKISRAEKKTVGDSVTYQLKMTTGRTSTEIESVV